MCHLLRVSAVLAIILLFTVNVTVKKEASTSVFFPMYVVKICLMMAKNGRNMQQMTTEYT